MQTLILIFSNTALKISDITCSFFGWFSLSPEEDRPVVEALAECGIALDKDNVFCVTTGNGQKLWICPVKECDRMYPRQSMLKVHILSHFNVRPFRVSTYTSPGQFDDLVTKCFAYIHLYLRLILYRQSCLSAGCVRFCNVFPLSKVI